jgi:acyl-CoA reductase-like NAD-dependent aldehyde dehydrogenase
MSNQVRTLSPSTGKVLFEHPGVTVEQVRQIAQASEDAFRTYRELSLDQRKAIVVKALEIIDANKETLAHELTTQMGRPISYTAGEVDTMRKRANYLIDQAEDALKTIPGQEENGFKRFVKKAPVGPVLLATAWNVSCPRLSEGLEANRSVSLLDHHQRTRPRAPCRKHRDPSSFTSDSSCWRSAL